MNKVISFIVGCIIGGILGGIQITAWGAELPIGYEDFVEVENPEEYLDSKHIEVPTEIRDMCEEYGLKYNICPELLEAIAWRESRFKPEVKNGNCVGLMQINIKVHRKRMKRLGVTDITEANENVLVAADYIKTLSDLNENLIEILNEYNGVKSSKPTSYTKEVIKIASALEQSGGD